MEAVRVSGRVARSANTAARESRDRPRLLTWMRMNGEVYPSRHVMFENVTYAIGKSRTRTLMPNLNCSWCSGISCANATRNPVCSASRPWYCVPYLVKAKEET